ncbi:MAG: hypothetical protein QOD14_2110 [Solirubrobacterales bacterium]|jgi:hypothetical protein|nr:hypothetical protein [Solirubrobacterales bacterium]
MPLVAAFQIGTILILVVLVALPVGAIVFALGAGGALKQIGKGDFAMEQDFPQSSSGSIHAVSAEVREEEIRQMIQARSDRGIAKGRKPLDVDAEVEKLLASESGGPGLGGDRGLREEVRQLVVARNERRQRQGKKPLDVEKEIDRQLSELENLGQ